MLDPLHVAAANLLPKASDVVGAVDQGLGAFGQDGQRKVIVRAPRRVALGNLAGVFAGAIQNRQLAVIDEAAITSQDCRVRLILRPRREKGAPEGDQEQDAEDRQRSQK